MDADKKPAWGQKCSKGCLLPLRIVATIMGFFALICAYTNRVSMSHVITKLVVSKNRTETHTGVCPPEKVSTEEAGYFTPGTYEWSEQLQGLVLGSFYIGYLITHLPGGILADEFGAKWVLGISLLISGLATVFSPIALQYGHEWGLMAMRIIMGAAQGPIFPALTTLLSHWVPAKERATLGTFCYSGVTAGTVLSNFCSGLMLHSFHWSITLYVFGSVTILWFIFFPFMRLFRQILLCTSSPSGHPCIKPKEMDYLEELIPKKADKLPIPWKQMMLSKAMLAVIISQIGHDWGYYVMISCLPKYMADVLQFSIRSNGILTAFPFLAMWVSSLLSGFLADWLIRSGKLSINLERKLFTFIGAFFPGLFMVIASYTGCNKTLVVVSFTLSLFTMGPYYAGQKLTPLDMSPSFSGTIMAITNGLGSFAGLFSPYIVGVMTPNATMNEWRWVFWLGLVILVVSAIIFWIWGSAEVQPYDPRAEQKKEG
ncbi:putative inorganic phosphate cotransporter isoform X1 [Drosophila novamexicana]|uniref:putative inorganic phosphate cotransporter isoform X1 n=1 Tax=Drosophila novamexicana TaxID=47314 RepID=UPI0011E5BFD1|nr:putative inorganic phosphate cotransporter isoform X1 [Drosophila novamexicana]XP_030569768.1 putative inorganic phosphate cotransporter isoform X1 [Drosophila novamexicana]